MPEKTIVNEGVGMVGLCRACLVALGAGLLVTPLVVLIHLRGRISETCATHLAVDDRSDGSPMSELCEVILGVPPFFIPVFAAVFGISLIWQLLSTFQIVVGLASFAAWAFGGPEAARIAIMTFFQKALFAIGACTSNGVGNDQYNDSSAALRCVRMVDDYCEWSSAFLVRFAGIVLVFMIVFGHGWKSKVGLMIGLLWKHWLLMRCSAGMKKVISAVSSEIMSHAPYYHPIIVDLTELPLLRPLLSTLLDNPEAIFRKAAFVHRNAAAIANVFVFCRFLCLLKIFRSDFIGYPSDITALAFVIFDIAAVFSLVVFYWLPLYMALAIVDMGVSVFQVILMAPWPSICFFVALVLLLKVVRKMLKVVAPTAHGWASLREFFATIIYFVVAVAIIALAVHDQILPIFRLSM